MPAGHMSNTAQLYLGGPTQLVDLSLGAGGFAIDCPATGVQVQALARDDVIRQPSVVDHSVTLNGIVDPDTQDDAIDTLDNGTRTFMWLSSVMPADEDRCLIGPVLAEQLGIETPYQEIVTVTGTMPAAGPWHLCRALAFEVDGVASGSDAITPSGTYSVAYLVITDYPDTADPTWTFAGGSVELTAEGIQGPEETTDTELEVTAWSGTGTITGYIVTGNEIAV